MKPPIEYDEAVKKIYDRIEDHKAANAEWQWQDSTDDQSVLRNHLTQKGKWYLERDRATLFEKSVADPAYYDMLRFALAEKIHLSLKLETDEAAWAAKALAGDHDVPSYKSRAYTALVGVRKFGLHTFVVNCVHVLRARGLSHQLACGAVAEACGKHNLDIRSASTVADIWNRDMPDFYRRASKNGGS
jgi:hypothetical protein